MMEPRLHESYGGRCASEHGFVDSIGNCGVGLSPLILSINTTPGSPFRCAPSTIFENRSQARTVFATSPVLGLTRSKSASRWTARMNLSVIATEMLKLLTFSFSRLHSMNSSMSGWSTLRMPMFAPRRVPPCFILSVEASKTCMNETGPEETPIVEETTSFFGRRRENPKPVPPPDLWIIAWCLRAS